MSDQVSADILGLTAKIVSAHVSKNQVGTDALPSLIQSGYRSLSTAGEVEPTQAPAQTPAVPIKKSVFPDYIVCVEDGKKLKMLKRHLQTSYGLSPDAYRAKWGLDASGNRERLQLQALFFTSPALPRRPILRALSGCNRGGGCSSMAVNSN